MSWEETKTVIVFENESKLKARFAEAWLRNPKQPFAAAFSIFNPDVGRALYAYNHWTNDNEVAKLKDELIAKFGSEHFLPTQDDLARELWDCGDKQNAELKLKYLELFAKVKGYIERPSETKVQVNVTQQSVMVVKDHGTNDQWEQKLLTQQQTLTQHD